MKMLNRAVKFAVTVGAALSLLSTHAAASALAPFPAFSAPRAVTHGPHDHFLANYFGINAWSPDNRYLLVLETDLKDKLPDGRPCTLGLVDLGDGNRFIPVMETKCWNFQEAAMAHWLPNERDTFVVNDLRDGKFVAVVKNWRTGAERVVPHPVSAVSEDGTWALSINYARLYLTRPDYGYWGDGQDARKGIVFPEDDGLWRVDLMTGEAKLVVSCASLKGLVPAVGPFGLSYICHTVISKDMKRVFFLSRSVSQVVDDETRKKGENAKWETTAFTCNTDGTCLRRIFPDGWGASHFNWKPALSERDARTMAITCHWEGERVCRHAEFTVGEESKAHKIGGETMHFDGHCIYSPDGNFITGDGYWDRDYYRHWKIVRLADEEIRDIGDFFVPPAYRNIYCRCDLHPRWRPDGRQIAFNSVHEGARQVYVRDVKPGTQDTGRGPFANAGTLVDFASRSCRVELMDGPAKYRDGSPEKQLEVSRDGVIVRTDSRYEKGHPKWMILLVRESQPGAVDWSGRKLRLVLAAPPSGRFSSHVAINLSDRDGEVFQLSEHAGTYNDHGEFCMDFDVRSRDNGKKGWGSKKANGIMEPPLKFESLALHFKGGADELGTVGRGEVILLRVDEGPKDLKEVVVLRDVVSREAISTDTMMPGATPFPGAKELFFKMAPPFDGSATLTLSHGSRGPALQGKLDRFQANVTNGLAIFKVDLPYDTEYQFVSIVCNPKGSGSSGSFSVAKAEGVFVQTAAEAVRFRVETGNPLHIVRDGKNEKPVAFFKNPSERDICIRSNVVLGDYFGNEVTIPFERRLKPGEEVSVDLPWPLPSRGIWRVRASVSGDDGSKADKDDRFAWIDLHEATPKIEKPKFRMGIHYHGTRYLPDKVDLTIAALVASGAKFTRCDFDHMWQDIERQPGVYTWEKSDLMIDKLLEAGLALDIIFAGTPKWAQDASAAERASRMKAKGYRVKNCNSLPREGLLRTFCEKYAHRYGGKIDYYECGNEWDLTGTGTTGFEDFLRVQKEAYEGLHAGYPDACVTPNGWTTAVSCTNGNPKVWQHGLVEYFADHPETYDAWALHCHGTPESFMVNISQRFLPLREAKPLKTRPWLLNETAFSCVNGMEDEVASAVWQKIVYGWAAGARDYIWYNLRATGWFDGDEPGYGLITADFRPRAGYAAFSALTTVLQGMDFDTTLHSKGLRHLFRFRGTSQAVKNGIVLIGWDTHRDNSACRIELKTDAKSAVAVDLMGNRTEVKVEGGIVVFAFGHRPQSLLLEGASRADVANMADLEREDSMALVVHGRGRRPDIVLNSAANVKNLYEANPAMIHRLWKGSDDHSARIWLVPADGGFIFRAIVEDDVRANGDSVEIVVVSGGAEDRHVLTSRSRQGTSDFYEKFVKTDSREVGIRLVVHDDDGDGEDSYLFLTREGEHPLFVRFE